MLTSLPIQVMGESVQRGWNLLFAALYRNLCSQVPFRCICRQPSPQHCLPILVSALTLQPPASDMGEWCLLCPLLSCGAVPVHTAGRVTPQPCAHREERLGPPYTLSMAFLIPHIKKNVVLVQVWLILTGQSPLSFSCKRQFHSSQMNSIPLCMCVCVYTHTPYFLDAFIH